MKRTQVIFEFDDVGVAKMFLAYMSDGGGEQPFLEQDDEVYIFNGAKRKPVSFDYDFTTLTCSVTSVKIKAGGK